MTTWIFPKARVPRPKWQWPFYGRYVYGGRHKNPVSKLVLHTTEGSTIAGAMSAYKARRVPPHITADPTRREVVQHIDLDRASEALWRHDDDGVIQIELVGHAVNTPHWTPGMLQWIGETVVAPILARFPAIGDSLPTFYGPDAGFTLASKTAPQRFTIDEWNKFSGVCGHQHVPDNDHWDPGKLDAVTILRVARAANETLPVTTEEEDMLVLIDTTTNDHWVAVGGKAKHLTDPSAWMSTWDGPVRKSPTMRYVVRALYSVV